MYYTYEELKAILNDMIAYEGEGVAREWLRGEDFKEEQIVDLLNNI